MTTNKQITHEEALKSTFWGGKRVDLPHDYEGFIKTVFGFESIQETKNKIVLQEQKQFPLSLPTSQLSEEVQRKLQAVKDCTFTTDSMERFIFSTGMSYLDLLQKRNGKQVQVVDGVVHPDTIKAVKEIISIVNEHKIQLLPTGGKSSVTETLLPTYTSLAVDLLKLHKILSFQPENKLVEVEAGILLPELEAWLENKGFALGHSPQSFISTTIGGAIASRGSGQFSSYFGSMQKIVHSVTVETPKGTFVDRINITPESAVGPSLSELFIGSEGGLGIITKAVLHIKPLQRKRFKAFLFKTFADGTQAIKEFYQNGLHPATVRLSDSYETELLFGTTKKEDIKNKLAKIYLDHRGYDTNHRCILFLYMEGERKTTKVQLGKISSICKTHGGISIGKGPAREWYKSRYDLPYLRESFLELGLLTDTIETATTYDKLENLHDITIKTLQQYCKFAMCHVSHVYEDGASLYFTFIGKEDFNWENLLIKRIRKEVIQGFVEHGGTLSHHHGVGQAFSEFLPQERSEVANGILQSVKDYLDPNNIMNPSAGLIYKKK